MAEAGPFFTNIRTVPTGKMKLGRGTGIEPIDPDMGRRKVDVINDDSGPVGIATSS